jgi:O-antigen/teichoic acid export membrane protein
MQKFGMPLVPSALALWTISFVDREFVIWYKNLAEAGVYSAALKVAGVITFVLVAFRTAWPAFAYSIEDDREAKRTYAYVLTYLLTLTSWAALALGALAPWFVRVLTDPRYQRAEKGVPLLAFAFTLYAGYTVLAIGSGRARRTQFNWVVTGIGAAVSVGLNFWLIPRWGMVGAAISMIVAYFALFVGMTLYAQRVFPVPYQWRRIVTAVGAAAVLTVVARTAHLPLAPSLLLVLVYPVALALLGFYLPAERQRLARVLRAAAP